MDIPQYIFQLKQEDIRKMLAAGNAREGKGIKLSLEGDALTISIDENAILDIVWCFVRSGQVKEGLSGAQCVVANNIKNTRGRVVLDPNYYT